MVVELASQGVDDQRVGRRCTWTAVGPEPLSHRMVPPEGVVDGEEAVGSMSMPSKVPPLIWLSGALNRSTAVNLLPVVREVLGDGFRTSHFRLTCCRCPIGPVSTP
jgi:hypothetical protein